MVCGGRTQSDWAGPLCLQSYTVGRPCLPQLERRVRRVCSRRSPRCRFHICVSDSVVFADESRLEEAGQDKVPIAESRLTPDMMLKRKA